MREATPGRFYFVASPPQIRADDVKVGRNSDGALTDDRPGDPCKRLPTPHVGCHHEIRYSRNRWHLELLTSIIPIRDHTADAGGVLTSTHATPSEFPQHVDGHAPLLETPRDPRGAAITCAGG